MLATLDEFSDEMTPFEGSVEESAALSSFIYFLSERPEAPTSQISGETLFESECSACHGPGDMSELVGGWELQQIRESLDILDQLSDEMVPYEGSAEEKDVLSNYLRTLGREN